MPLLISRSLIGTGSLIGASMLYLASLNGKVPESILVLLLVHTAYVFSVYLVVKHGGRRLFIIPAALLFRVVLAPLPAPFTDDLYRYRWEARVQQAGGNPYEATPSDARWQTLRDETHSRIPGSVFKAVYGPAWEWISLWTLRAAQVWTRDPVAQALWFKIPAALFDLGTIAALVLLLRLRGLPESRVLIYAWAPLPIWEFWGNGHNDAAAVFFVVMSLALAGSRLRAVGGMALGAAVAVKWWPVLLLPAYAKRNFRAAGIAAGTVLCLAVPFFTDARENARFATGFVGGWRNNDSLFGALLWLTGDLQKAKYVAFGLIGASVAWIASRDWPLERAALWTICCVLLLSANCHPWYLAWMIPLLAVYPHPCLLLWTSLVPLAYITQIEWKLLGEWDGSPPERWWIYGPVFSMMLYEVIRWRVAVFRRVKGRSSL